MLRSLQFWAGVLISGLFIMLFLRATNFRDLSNALEEANYWWLFPAVAVLFVAVIVRCLRWSILMKPLGDFSPWRLFPYAVIGYMANNLLPARVGDAFDPGFEAFRKYAQAQVNDPASTLLGLREKVESDQCGEEDDAGDDRDGLQATVVEAH